MKILNINMNHGFSKLVRGLMLLLLFFTMMPVFSQTTIIKRHAGSKSAMSKNQSKSTPNSKTRGVLNGHDWVDLGLPSGTKWATCNVGTSSPEKAGGYYAWGETKTKTVYEWGNCFDCIDSTGSTKWGIYKQSGKTRIDPNSGHDVARVKWGGTWRMPTLKDFEELINNCRWKWERKRDVNGCVVIGPNGNSIFLPAGFGDTTGYYWSNTLSESDPYAQNLYFDDKKQGIMGYGRLLGLNIRPVSN